MGTIDVNVPGQYFICPFWEKEVGLDPGYSQATPYTQLAVGATASLNYGSFGLNPLYPRKDVLGAAGQFAFSSGVCVVSCSFIGKSPDYAECLFGFMGPSPADTDTQIGAGYVNNASLGPGDLYLRTMTIHASLPYYVASTLGMIATELVQATTFAPTPSFMGWWLLFVGGQYSSNPGNVVRLQPAPNDPGLVFIPVITVDNINTDQTPTAFQVRALIRFSPGGYVTIQKTGMSLLVGQANMIWSYVGQYC